MPLDRQKVEQACGLALISLTYIGLAVACGAAAILWGLV